MRSPYSFFSISQTRSRFLYWSDRYGFSFCSKESRNSRESSIFHPSSLMKRKLKPVGDPRRSSWPAVMPLIKSTFPKAVLKNNSSRASLRYPLTAWFCFPESRASFQSCQSVSDQESRCIRKTRIKYRSKGVSFFNDFSSPRTIQG